MDVVVGGAGRCYKIGDELPGVVAHVEGIVSGLNGKQSQNHQFGFELQERNLSSP